MCRYLYLLMALVTVGGCQSESGPPLAVSEVALFLPLPGSKASVAYFVIANNSASTINIDTISSPQFGDVQLHETTITGGIARMQALARLQISAGEQVRFGAGGKHVMLMQPVEDHDIGSPVDLNIHYDEGGLITINTRALSRTTGE